METRANYIIVGLFVIGFSAIFVCLLLWFLAAQGQHKEYNKYTVYLNESVTGLNEQAPVRFSGVNVGFVSYIELNHKNPQQVKLTLNIVVGTPINESTTAMLMTQGITGVTYLGLKAKAANAKLLERLPDNPYPIIRSEPSILMQVDTAIREVTKDVKEMNTAFQKLLNKENQEAIHGILVNSEKFTRALSDNSGELTQALKQGNNLTRTLSEQAAPNMIQAIDRLYNVLNDVEKLTHSLKDNPSMLMRGKSPPPPGPGE
jgi:phospholipid/cholesterol/gamma-HCH transport system substrate-binding protein